LNQIFRQLPEPRVRLLLLRIFGDAENAGQDADDIAIQNRRRLIEGDAADRSGGVAADAGQRQNLLELFRKFPAVFIHDELRGLLQIADARVIAESFPEFVDFGRRRARGSLYGRQFLQPAVPERDDRLHLRLLQHDFGDPDGVGITRAAPRQVARVRGEPVQQGGNQFGKVRLRRAGTSRLAVV